MKRDLPASVFVTGTDTGVGKTWVAASLLASLRAEGIDAVPMKPVQTGCVTRGGRLVAPDLAMSLRHAGMRPGAGEMADMAPYCFKPACSPHLAAAGAGVQISLSAIKASFRRLSRGHDMVIVEGAGGVMVPLDTRRTMLDLMVSLGVPVILVARPGLGTINHTLLSLQALRQAGLTLLGVVLNQSTPGRWGRIEDDNVRVIECMGNVQILACCRYGDALEMQALPMIAGR